ncbi:MAG: hypothetical protein ACRCZK_00340 [Oscillospiraceae bacterium]
MNKKIIAMYLTATFVLVGGFTFLTSENSRAKEKETSKMLKKEKIIQLIKDGDERDGYVDLNDKVKTQKIIDCIEENFDKFKENPTLEELEKMSTDEIRLHYVLNIYKIAEILGSERIREMDDIIKEVVIMPEEEGEHLVMLELLKMLFDK